MTGAALILGVVITQGLAVGAELMPVMPIADTAMPAAEAEAPTKPTLPPGAAEAAAAVAAIKARSEAAAAAAAAPAADGRAGGGYRFRPTDPPRFYLYEARQEAAWTSAGETLRFTTTLAWSFRLRCRSASADEAVLTADILHVWAKVQGPGSDHAVNQGRNGTSDGERALDSAIPAGPPDPLLGHLAAFDGATLDLHLDPRTGLVRQVDGGQRIVERLATLAPDRTRPGGPSPLAEAASRIYDSGNLARLWSTMLARPGSGALELAQPLAGSLSRAWSGERYELVPGDAPLTLVLGSGPTASEGTLEGLTGTGGATRIDGWPGDAWGDLTGRLRFTALTQPVVQDLRLRWKLSPLPMPGQ